ncbi:hypothetical protein B0H17DRAFT_1210827 [Mycena rosella]|uniref:DUF6534 domain-containing protein n=1 Tax=Mycena rosella TaxID=1033263 RepID=A0AAD7G6X9_MYCRO|nr:hypothetical protein B0H17DRAFT_1210827 [Mycena rosella]
MSTELPPHLLDNTYGAELASSYAATALWGVHCLQTFLYFNIYTEDATILKVLVAWTWLADTVHQGLILSLEYSTLIKHFGDLGPIFEINKEVILQGFFTIAISVPVQLFFLHRIWRLSGDRAILPLFMVVCLVLETVTGITYFQWALRKSTKPTDLLSGTKRATGITYLITAASVDVIIAMSMVFLLRATKVHGMTQTRRMVSRLIVYSVNTGLWTALLAVFCAMTMIAYPETFVFIGLYMPISALYCNTLLANLNIRQYVRGTGHDVISLGPTIATTLEFSSEVRNHTKFCTYGTDEIDQGGI